MTPQLLDEEALSAWTKYRRTGDIERFLNHHHIPYFRGKGGTILTTVGLIEASQQQQAQQEEEASF